MRILVFRLGFLGDTLVAIPALWMVRKHFGDAHIDYLSEDVGRAGLVSPKDVLPAGLLIKRFLGFPRCSYWGINVSLIAFFIKIVCSRYNALVYLAPSRRTAKQIRRDLLFFRCAGITRLYGVIRETPNDGHTDYTRQSEHEVDFLLRHLAAQGIGSPGHWKGQIQLGLSMDENVFAETWMDKANIPVNARQRLLAVGPGGKMPAKKWPIERYEFVVSDLIRRYNVWPVVFGGNDDAGLGATMLAGWGRGTLAAGVLEVRPAAAVLARCLAYLGNDTGTMHLAAAAGIPCVALFSARDVPGRWDPYGSHHRVFRHRISCEGCMLEICDRGNECLVKIEVADVISACNDVILAHGICSGQ